MQFGFDHFWFLCLQVGAAGSMATVGSINLLWWSHARSERTLASTGLLCLSAALTLLVGAIGLSFAETRVAEVVVPVRAVLIGVTIALFIATMSTLVPLPAVRAATAASVALPVVYSALGLAGGGSYTFVEGSPWPRVGQVGDVLVGLSVLIFIGYAVKAVIGLASARRLELAAAITAVLALLIIPVAAGPGEMTEAATTLWTLPIAVLLAWWCSTRVLTLQGSLLSAEAGRRQAEHAAWYEARHDRLTGLPNRAAAADTLTALLHDTVDTSPVVVAELQIGGMGEVQAVAGQATVDVVIQAIAGHLVSVLPVDTAVARVSETSFVVIHRVAPGASAGELQEQVEQALGFMRRATDVPNNLAMWVGVAINDGSGSAAHLMEQAATAATAAEHVQGRVQVYRPELREQIVHRARLARLLSVAVDRDEFELHYQPVFDTTSLTRVGVEALVRWRHHGKLHPPAEWIPIAEQQGLMPLIGLHVLRLAARDRAAVGCPIAVNVSACQLSDPGFAADVLDVLRDIDHETIILEVTESFVMADFDRAYATLTVLRDHGIRIALDDFGTEYSSLSRLASMPFDILKIDRSFVAGITTPHGRAIVTAVQALARALGKTTVAEGIETREQLAIISEIGCDNVQGFLTGRPTSLAEQDVSATHRTDVAGSAAREQRTPNGR